MSTVVLASIVGTAAAGGTLGLTWEDCGDATTLGHVTDVHPSTLTLGETTTIQSTGTFDKGGTGGTFTMKVTAGGGVVKETYTGDLCEEKVFKLPLGLGQFTWSGLDCPVQPGTIQIGTDVKLSSIIPAGMATADLSLTAIDQDSNPAVCVNMHMKKQDELELPPTSGDDYGLGFNVHLTAPKGDDSYPVILFVSGFSGLAPAYTYSTFINELSDKGYIVVGLDHVKAPNYPKQGADFLNVMEWVKAGNLTQALRDAKISASPDVDRLAVMGQSAGNHVVGQGLQDSCSLAKAQVMIDPVDGFDPFGMVHKEDLIIPGQKLKYTTPTLLLDNELDPVSKNKLFPACAPAKLGAPRWFDAVAGPVFNVNASKYGHIDCLNDLFIKAGTIMCPSDKTTDKKAYKAHLAATIDLFLDGVFQGHTDNFKKLEDASSFGVDVTLRQDLKDMEVSDIRAGCTNQAVVV